MVESGYVDGIPPHRLPSAMEPNYDPSASCIFVVPWDKFKVMKAADVQEQFRHRHILVLGAPVQTVNFDHEGLETVGSLQAPYMVHGEDANFGVLHLSLRKSSSGISLD